MARVWLGGLVAAVVVGTCFVARADGPTAVVRDDDSLTRDHARELFLHGIELSDQVRWAEALDWFRESYARRAAAAPLLNIGIALRAIGRHREAAETFTQFLAVFGGRNAEHDRLARQYRDEALGSVARVRVRGLPRGASLSVDGRAARGERAGDEVVVVVDPGEHVVMARSRDGRTVRETVRLVPGDERVVPMGFSGAGSRARRRRSGNVVAPVVLLSAGGLSVGMGLLSTVFLVNQLAELEDCREADMPGRPSGEFCMNETALEERRDLYVGTTVTFGVLGVTLSAVGVVLLAVGAGGDEDAQAASIACGPSGTGLACSGRF